MYRMGRPMRAALQLFRAAPVLNMVCSSILEAMSRGGVVRSRVVVTHTIVPLTMSIYQCTGTSMIREWGYRFVA